MKKNIVKLGLGATLLVAGAVVYKALQGGNTEYVEVEKPNDEEDVVELKLGRDYIDVEYDEL